VQVDSFHRSNTAKWKAGKTASSVQVHGLVQGREWQAVQTAGQMADAKTSAKSQYLVLWRRRKPAPQSKD
jgi:hypothetical protein